LAELLADPYAAVRFNAHRSLRQLPGFSNFAYDYVGMLAAREQARKQARKQWEELSAMPLEQTGRHVLITSDDRFQQDRLTHIIRQRDDRPIRIAE